ncbi:MAG: hypothetical protein NT002_00725 [candidate division Zixibacteria bacterium]|nr:hypothetical protein [candidate division Zixibacteria bacterium]
MSETEKQFITNPNVKNCHPRGLYSQNRHKITIKNNKNEETNSPHPTRQFQSNLLSHKRKRPLRARQASACPRAFFSLASRLQLPKSGRKILWNKAKYCHPLGIYTDNVFFCAFAFIGAHTTFSGTTK